MSQPIHNDSQAMSAIAANTARALALQPDDPLFRQIVSRAADRSLDILQRKHPGLTRDQVKQIAIMELGQ